jgi:hypothetical protein
MNIYSLYLYKKAMKNSLIIKIFVVLPIIVFIDYLIMVLLGCVSCLFGFGDDFYCGPYCLFGKIILGMSAILFLFIIFTDLIQVFKKIKNVTATKE